MAATVRITLEPLGRTLEAPSGGPLQDLLFGHGVEFPCGGQGACRGCRVRLLAGDSPATPEERLALSDAEIESGWRLGCCLRPEKDITLEIAQWETAILGDDTLFAFQPCEGLGIAVDVGTTTVVAQLVDLTSGRVLGVRSALNPQAVYGADVMRRIEAALLRGAGAALTDLIRACVGELVTGLQAGAGLREVVLAGNTVMHHLFCGYDVEPLAHVPFQTGRGDLAEFRGGAWSWLPEQARLRFLPCLGGFVGSDILAGILATRIHESETPACLIDLGTNGEIVIGNRDRILCASTAAGPAFEGGLISTGMRAATGAIFQVRAGRDGLVCRVLGDVSPRGICGSGMVDLVAAGLDLGAVAPNGRLADGPWVIAPPVALVQNDIRELQLAKAAVAAGVRVLLKRLGWTPNDIHRVHLAGAFGNYVAPASARRIGLMPFPEGVIKPSGNTALLGAKLALFEEDGAYASLRARIQHVPLAEDAGFLDAFTDEMAFPATAS
jgi:uncharacterized 2Fe-2S/4Fe-4S cluster protein (DUF4445 family)